MFVITMHMILWLCKLFTINTQHNLSVWGFPMPSCFTSIFHSPVMSWNMQFLFGINFSPKLIASNQFKNVHSV